MCVWGEADGMANQATQPVPMGVKTWQMYASRRSSLPDCTEHIRTTQPVWKLSYMTKQLADFVKLRAAR